MMAKEKPDVVTVLTESGLHAQRRYQLAYGADIVEKPMALTLEDADKMIEAMIGRAYDFSWLNKINFNVPVVELRKL